MQKPASLAYRMQSLIRSFIFNFTGVIIFTADFWNIVVLLVHEENMWRDKC